MIKAKFIGEDGIMGYRAGNVYVLHEHRCNRNPIAVSRATICPCCQQPIQKQEGYWEYSSLAAFFSNWAEVEPMVAP